jgi:hypothetical protein
MPKLQIPANVDKVKFLNAVSELENGLKDKKLGLDVDVNRLKQQLRDVLRDADSGEFKIRADAQYDQTIAAIEARVKIDPEQLQADLKEATSVIEALDLPVEINETPVVDALEHLYETYQNKKMGLNVDTAEAEQELQNLWDEYAKPLDIKISASDMLQKVKVVFNPDTQKTDSAIERIKKPTKSIHRVNPDVARAQSAINKLKVPTSSTHTVYVKTVHTAAAGGGTPVNLNIGGRDHKMMTDSDVAESLVRHLRDES